MLKFQSLQSSRLLQEHEMTRFQERTVRKSGQWVKITRDNKLRTFSFARGYEGAFQSHAFEMLSMKWVANWKEATERAMRAMATYA
jgi:CTP-dependent riboflavin kinase